MKNTGRLKSGIKYMILMGTCLGHALIWTLWGGVFVLLGLLYLAAALIFCRRMVEETLELTWEIEEWLGWRIMPQMLGYDDQSLAHVAS